MKMRFALLAACAGTFVIAHAPMALAINNPIPGVDIVVKKHPGGNAITVGNCQSGGGKVVKLGGQWACTGLPASKKSAAGTSSKSPQRAGIRWEPSDDTTLAKKGGKGTPGAAINTTRSNIKRPN